MKYISLIFEWKFKFAQIIHFESKMNIVTFRQSKYSFSPFPPPSGCKNKILLDVLNNYQAKLQQPEHVLGRRLILIHSGEGAPYAP